MRTLDITEQKFGRLVALNFDHRIGYKVFWKFKCECGKTNISNKGSVTSGNVKSCGCLNDEAITKHGLYGSRFFRIYKGILRRCNNKNEVAYKNYGGRGIICKWSKFIDFIKDMHVSYEEHVKEYGEKNTTIDRINVNGNYCKANCRWATCKEQSNNTRKQLINKI